MNGLRPVDTKTTSPWIVPFLPSGIVSKSNSTRPPAEREPVTFVEVIKLTPIFFIERTNVVTQSVSIIDKILSAYSITVTFEPKRAQTEPSSKPITPPPTTNISLGIESKAKAPVEETIFFSSYFKNGNSTGTEPVAIQIFFVFKVCFALSAPVTSTVFAEVILP